MFIIPGHLIAILTFPGIIVHEIAHRFFCDITNTPVYAVCYFRASNPAGYVIHAPTKGLFKNFLISIGPLIINSALCIIIAFPYQVLDVLDLQNQSIIFYFLTWVGISIGMHAIPSNTDIKNFMNELESTNNKNIFYIFSWILVGFVKIANILSFLWFDLIYAFFISSIIPKYFI